MVEWSYRRMELSSPEIVESRSGPLVECWNLEELSNRRMIEWCSCQIFEWLNGRIGEVVEGSKVECWIG